MRTLARALIPAALLGTLISAVGKHLLVTAGAPLWLVVSGGAVGGTLGAAFCGYRLGFQQGRGGAR